MGCVRGTGPHSVQGADSAQRRVKCVSGSYSMRMISRWSRDWSKEQAKYFGHDIHISRVRRHINRENNTCSF